MTAPLDGVEATIQGQLRASAPPAAPVRWVSDCMDVAHMDRFDPVQARAAVALVTLKVCEGCDAPDPLFMGRYAACAAVGYPEIEGYQFGTNAHPGEVQWADFQRRWDATCEDHGRDPRAVAVWLDCEPEHGSEMSADKARAWLRTGRAAGYQAGLYGFESNLRGVFTDPLDEVGQYPLWLAWYGPDPATVSLDKLPAPWRKTGATRWQYSDGANHPARTDLYPVDVPGCGRPDRSCRRVP